MYHTESMITMMEDMQRQAAEMERNVKERGNKIKLQ